MDCTRHPALHLGLLAPCATRTLPWLVIGLATQAAGAQTQALPPGAVTPAPPAAAASAPEDERDEREAARKGRERTDRTVDQAAPQTMADAPLTPQGEEPPPSVIRRGPLNVRRDEASLGFDHALSSRWVLGGLLGTSRARSKRHQLEIFDGVPEEFGNASDTAVRTRNTLYALTLTHYPRPDVFLDTTVAFMRSHLQMERLVNDAALFEGNTQGRSWNVAVSGGGLWRSGRLAWVPQLGLSYVDAKVDAMPTTESFPFEDPPTIGIEGFRVGEQRQKTLSALLGGQLQWTQSVPFGTLTPYTRASWQQRLWMRADPVVSTTLAREPVLVDLGAATSRRVLTLAVGALAQLPGGTSLFAELSHARGNADLHEKRASIGLKFEK